MTAIELLQATRDYMGRTGEGIGTSLWFTWRQRRPGIEIWNEACRALVAYADPYAEGVPNCHLYGYVKSFERRAPYSSQLDAIDYAVDFLGGIHSQLDSVIDPRD